MERYYYYYHQQQFSTGTSKSIDSVNKASSKRSNMTPWNCIDAPRSSCFSVSRATIRNNSQQNMSEKKHAFINSEDGNASNSNNFRFLSALSSLRSMSSSSSSTANKCRALNEENINYMVNNPSSVEGKITRRALLERIFNDPLLLREFQKKLRECRQPYHCHTNAGVMAHVNYDTKLLHEMAQLVLLGKTSDENKCPPLLHRRQPSYCPLLISEEDEWIHDDDDDTIVPKVQHCRRFSFLSDLEEGLDLSLSKSQQRQQQCEGGTTASSSVVCSITDYAKRPNTNSPFRRLPVSRNLQQAKSQEVIDDYGWQKIMMKQQSKSKRYFVVETNNNKKRNNKKKHIAPSREHDHHMQEEPLNRRQMIQRSTTSSNRTLNIAGRKCIEHISVGNDINSSQITTATATANGNDASEKDDEHQRRNKSLSPVSVSVVPSTKWYIRDNKAKESLDQTFVVAKSISLAAPSKSHRIKSAPSA